MKKKTSDTSTAAKAAEAAAHADLRAYRSFKELEYSVLSPAGWVRHHEAVVSNFEDGPGAVWRVMRMYAKPDDPDAGGLVAVKTQVTREAAAFVVFYKETQEP